ncbi:uncharacterized protein L203_101443 [Cryptococcus depauperatus CBS 7841]|uniref:Signal peptidase complex subunit 2 n=1 Tax=Cryptococcus depauperatus CBS 7841 TaxID=1295531 RepID=A0AAJ8LZ71_9TREE
MAQKKSIKKASETAKAGEELSQIIQAPLPTIKVNNANIQEIKMALDEVVKKVGTWSFTPSLLHPTVHLGLGYSSVILALSSMLYSLRVSFEDSKPVLWVAVIGYLVLQAALWAWKRWVEKGEVFKGKRRRMVKRIETDHVQIISSTTLDPPSAPVLTLSPHTRPSSPFSDPSSSMSSSSPTSKTSLLNTSASPTGPSYVLQLNLSTTSNNGKSLIHKSRIVAGKGVGEFVDEEGGVEEGEFKKWLGVLLGEAGLAGTEDEGTKEE